MNPAKSIFGVDEGKLLGHIISKDGVKVDPERVEAIKKVPLPQNLKALQSFNGQINFIRRFISNLAELMKSLQKLLKKDANFEWTDEGKIAFKSIKDAISMSPAMAPKYVVSLHTPGSCGRNIQATRCALGGKYRVKVVTLFLTSPFRLNS